MHVLSLFIQLKSKSLIRSVCCCLLGNLRTTQNHVILLPLQRCDSFPLQSRGYWAVVIGVSVQELCGFLLDRWTIFLGFFWLLEAVRHLGLFLKNLPFTVLSSALIQDEVSSTAILSMRGLISGIALLVEVFLLLYWNTKQNHFLESVLSWSIWVLNTVNAFLYLKRCKTWVVKPSLGKIKDSCMQFPVCSFQFQCNNTIKRFCH